jgi:hypothetical protein
MLSSYMETLLLPATIERNMKTPYYHPHTKVGENRTGYKTSTKLLARRGYSQMPRAAQKKEQIDVHKIVSVGGGHSRLLSFQFLGVRIFQGVVRGEGTEKRCSHKRIRIVKGHDISGSNQKGCSAAPARKV